MYESARRVPCLPASRLFGHHFLPVVECLVILANCWRVRAHQNCEAGICHAFHKSRITSCRRLKCDSAGCGGWLLRPGSAPRRSGVFHARKTEQGHPIRLRQRDSSSLIRVYSLPSQASGFIAARAIKKRYDERHELHGRPVRTMYAWGVYTISRTNENLRFLAAFHD